MNELVFVENNIAVTDSLMVAEVFGKRHDDVLKKIDSLDCSVEFSLRNFTESEYENERGKIYRKFIIKRDGLVFLVMGYTGKKAAEFKEKYIEAFNRMEDTLKNQVKNIASYMIDDPIERAKMWIVEQEEKQQLRIESQAKDKVIEEKTEIIEGIAHDIPVAAKRKILNRVVKKGSNIQGRYSMLYQEFNDQYGLNVQLRYKNYNDKNKPKMKSVMDYIDKQLDMIPDLYEIAVKLYESDVNKLVQELFDLRNENELIVHN